MPKNPFPQAAHLQGLAGLVGLQHGTQLGLEVPRSALGLLHLLALFVSFSPKEARLFFWTMDGPKSLILK